MTTVTAVTHCFCRGGTRIEAWSDPSALAVCNSTVEKENAAAATSPALLSEPYAFAAPGFNDKAGPGPNNATVLYNAMVFPYTIGPMAIKAVTWFQGEANAGDPVGYACKQPAMIRQWRTAFQQQFYFSFVQLEPWIAGAGYTLAEFRIAQLNASNTVPYVDFASAIDIGDPLGPFGSVHPRAKQVVGRRMADALLSTVYGQSIPHAYPTYSGAVDSSSGNTLSVTVSFNPSTIGSGLQMVPGVHCPTELTVPVALCAWWTITGSDGTSYNATASLTSDATGVVLTATAAAAGTKATATSYGYGTWPVLPLYNSYGYPAQPWNQSVAASDVAPAPAPAHGAPVVRSLRG